MSPLSTFATALHEKFQTLKHIALIAHKAPDGDAYGSLEGLYQLLRSNYPELTVTLVIPKEKQTDSHVNWVLSTE